MAQRKIIIAGVGRSGTSFLFEEVAAALKTCGEARFFYEPYLWNPAQVNKRGAVRHEPFDTRNLSPFGIYVHCASPLFLDGSHPVHDQMNAHLFGHGDHAMSKMIRGNGRLKAYLGANPDLRVLGMVRDVMGTVNSAANHFSFFGEEFHPTDRPRFRIEVQRRFGARTPFEHSDEVSRQATLSGYWWQFMTRALLEAKAAFPDRVCLVDYGSLRTNPDGAYAAIDRFLDLPVSAHRLKKRIGIVSSANYLKDVPSEILAPFHDWSREVFADLKDGFVEPASPLLQDYTAVRQSYGVSTPGVVPQYPLYSTAVGWRYALSRRDRELADLRQVGQLGLAALSDASVEALRTRLPAPELLKGRPKVSVIMPVWNGADTLERSVASIWAQKDVSAEVVLVDDLSTDTTVEIASGLLEKGPGRLVRNQRNLGPAQSRHKGIMAAEHPIVSTLDADDIILPGKLAAEIEAISGDPGVVAFSDVLYRRSEDLRRWSFDHMEAMEKSQRVALFAARKTTLPRDMTLYRSLYERTRGFNCLLRMYEDWALKIELAGIASDWRATGEAGTLYEHKRVGQSAGEPPKHRFWMVAAYLHNAEALALQHGGRAIDYLQASLSQFGVPDFVVAGLDDMRRRSAFSGNIIEDFMRMRRVAHQLIPRNDLDFTTRLQRIFEMSAQTSMAAE